MSSLKSIRKATVQDAEAVARIYVCSWQHAYRGIIPDDFLSGLTVSKRLEFWNSRLAVEPDKILVVEIGLEVVGFADFGPSRDDQAAPTTAELNAIYIAPGHWNSGCGNMLWDGVESILKAARFSQVTLWVLAGNQRGRRFYERHGFNADGATKLVPFSNATLAEMRYVKNFQLVSTGD